MDFIMTIVEQGLIYGILTLGIYITYKILDFPDLTVDGSFPLGAAVTAALITRGVNPYLTIPIAFLVGVLAGICTGLIHVKCKVRDLFDFTSEYRNPFFVCLIQNRRERANHRVICQVGQAVYFRQQICGCKRNLGAAGDSCGLQGKSILILSLIHI